MVGILVITHGEVAPALVSTAQVILGELDGISAVGLTPQMNREEAWKPPPDKRTLVRQTETMDE